MTPDSGPSTTGGRFGGHVVLITGSSSGIGAATARQFAARGATVVVNSSSSVAAGRALAAELPHATYVQADIADEAACIGMIDEVIATHGRLDVLVNNAGTREVRNAISLSTGFRTFQVAIAATSSFFTNAPSSLRSRFSRRIFKEKGSVATVFPASDANASSRYTTYDWPSSDRDARDAKLFEVVMAVYARARGETDSGRGDGRSHYRALRATIG